jgi:hypothetical protein
MAGGNRRIVQEDFSAGAFPSTSYDNIPANGLVDAQNLLVDDDRSLKMRGGSAWAAPAMGVGSIVPWSWSGVIGSTRRTLIANASGVAASDDLGGTTSVIAAATVPDPAPAVSLAGLAFLPGGQTISPTLVLGAAARVKNFYAVAGNRLWAASLNETRVDFSDVGVPATFGATSFHEIAEGGILGLMGLRDAVVVFTTAGVWVISNVGLNLTDATGNVQHRIDRYSRSLVLWSANGLGAAHEGALVVPALDGVYLLGYGVASEAPQQFTMISQPINNRYRSYVAAGYMPGQPTVHRGHLFLPIRTAAGAFVDLLVCKLDATDASGRLTFPWTRITHVATGPLTVATSVFTGNLIGGGVGDDRLMRLAYFVVPIGAPTDADGQAWSTYAQARSPITPTGVATLTKFRVGYALAGAGSIEAQYQDEDGAVTLAGTAAANPTDLEPYLWRVSKRARYSSMKVTHAVSADYLFLKSFEWFLRDRGRV